LYNTCNSADKFKYSYKIAEDSLENKLQQNQQNSNSSTKVEGPWTKHDASKANGIQCNIAQ